MDKLLYIRYSTERTKSSAICTEIRQDESGKKYVIKRPYSAEAKAHVENLFQWFKKLSEIFEGTDIKINQCEPKEDSMVFEYLEGKTLEEELDILLEDKNYEGFFYLMRKFFDILVKNHSQTSFIMTEEFKKVFGDLPVPEGLPCGQVNNIDMIFRNVIIHEGWNVIDYEWTFDFPVPVAFVIYRGILHYMDREKIKGKLAFDLFEEFNITPEDKELYHRMERGFISHVTGGLYSVRMHGVMMNNRKIAVIEELEKNSVEIEWRKEEAKFYQDELQRVYDSRSFKVAVMMSKMLNRARGVLGKRTEYS